MDSKQIPYVDPLSHKPLRIIKENEKISMVTDEGSTYPFFNEIPDLTYPVELKKADRETKEFYDQRSEAYEKNLHLTFKTHNENEEKCRNSFVDSLDLKPDYKVLDLACGTGRDSLIIANRLNRNGKIFMVDISYEMIKICKEKTQHMQIPKEYCIANAAYLPFPDNFFDALYSFGAVGEFSEIKKSLFEMVRVTKPGGKIVIGDESIPPWLRETYFAKVLMTTNPQFKAELPLNEMPIEARNVRLRWVIGGVFYLIDFEVGEGEPSANFDFEIPGIRGGTYRTRYEGQLEGVTPEAKKLAYEIVKKKGISMHQWLDMVVKNEAKKEFK